MPLPFLPTTYAFYRDEAFFASSPAAFGPGHRERTRQDSRVSQGGEPDTPQKASQTDRGHPGGTSQAAETRLAARFEAQGRDHHRSPADVCPMAEREQPWRPASQARTAQEAGGDSSTDRYNGQGDRLGLPAHPGRVEKAPPSQRLSGHDPANLAGAWLRSRA